MASVVPTAVTVNLTALTGFTFYRTRVAPTSSQRERGGGMSNAQFWSAR